MTVDPAEHAVQLDRLRTLCADWAAQTRTVRVRDLRTTARRWAVADRPGSPSRVLVGRAVGAEVGQPGAGSHSLVLTTRRPGLVQDGRVRIIGRPLADCAPDRPRPFAQAILLQLDGQTPPRHRLESAAFLTGRLPGHMARAVPGRLWLRFSREIVEQNFTWRELGAVLLWAYRQDFEEIGQAEVLLVADEPAAVAALDATAAELRVLSGRQTKLKLVGEGEAECPDLDCEACAHRDVCDALRDITVRYRKRRNPNRDANQ